MKKKLTLLFPLVILLGGCTTTEKETIPDKVSVYTLEKSVLQDKIKGAWAGQTIGVTFGGPTEFKFNGTMIQDYTPIPWYEGVVEWWYNNAPGLYDDIYMDLTFVDIIERIGIDAPADSFAMAFATASYPLWHANQAARVNILRGIMPPESGHWKNNPHADCIDYQIEADFAGIMSPGMVNSASKISDKIGRIMNYGDGLYGGIYVGAMYSLAFVSNDIEYIVKEALKTIPDQSDFYQCIRDVVDHYEKGDNDWKSAWFQVERNWSEDIGCPDGVHKPFNIDAKVNAAYIVIGLLYGKGDFTSTLDISTRCGQDSDCNPASAGGILGTVLGYERIPEEWKKEIVKVEDRDFRFTTISLNDVYKLSYQHALQQIEKSDGEILENEVKIAFEVPKTVPYEKAFSGLYPSKREEIRKILKKDSETLFTFTGTGVVLGGWVNATRSDYVAEVLITLDGKEETILKLPADFLKRWPDFYWNYELEKKEHQIELRHLNPEEGASVEIRNFVVYSDEKVKPLFMAQ